MKLTKEQKSELKVFKEMASDANVVIAINKDLKAVIAFYQDFPYAKTVNVTVSHMDPTETDKFRVNTGVYFALKRIFNGETIKMPVGKAQNVVFLANDLMDRLAA
jgi:hypothetical protein